jgi:lipoprotein-releasing system permease protein
MRFELFIALRYLLTRNKQSFISVISLISVLGVGLGVAALIVVIGVMNGFSTDLREKILGVNAHVIVLSMSGGVTEYRQAAATARDVDGVKAATPFIYAEVMLSNASGVKGVVLRGIDPESAGRVLRLPEDMERGGLAGLARTQGVPGIVIGEELASRLGIGLGGRVNLLSPSGRASAAGFQPTVRVYEVVGIFDTGIYEYDSSMAYVSLDSARSLLGYKEVRATGLELKVDDVYNADEVAGRVQKALGPPFYTRHWMEMNENLFAALKLEKTAMFIILTMIVMVGSFSIITTLVMLVMEKTRDIAILMSMGARRANIRRIFMYQGMLIGAAGTALGYVLGITASLLLKRYQFIKLPENVYSMDRLAIRLEWLDLTAIGVAALALCFLATIYPARQASSLEPAQALRFE